MNRLRNRRGYRKVTVQVPLGERRVNGWVISDSDERPVKNLDGRSSKKSKENGSAAFFKDVQGYWRRTDSSIDVDLDDLCGRTHGHIRRSLLNDAEISIYHDRLPDWVHMAGLEPESKVSKHRFEQLMAGSGSDPYFHKFLYLHDIQSLLTNIQRTSSQIFQSSGEFYGLLNDSSFFQYTDQEKVGLRSIVSGEGILLHAHLENTFVRMRSLLDYAVKIALEDERDDIDFSVYPKLKGAGKQYADKKMLKMNNSPDTVFEDTELIREIASIRDRIIHDGHFDISARVYESFKRGRLVERFVLVPDMTEGRFDVFRNRRNFFGDDNKMNLRLPSILDNSYGRVRTTVGLIHDNYAKQKRA